MSIFRSVVEHVTGKYSFINAFGLMSESKALRISYLLLASLFLVRAAPIILGNCRCWGINHLIFLPDIFTAVYLCLAGIALVLPFSKQASSFAKSVLTCFSKLFFESRRRAYHRFLFILVMAGLFAVFAAPTHFLGDGYTLIGNLASESGTFFKWSEKWITVLLQTIQSILGEKNAHTARLSFQIVSVFSGAISIWFLFSISEIISDNSDKRFLIFSAMFFAGTLLLFFGYVENYPALLACFIAYVFFSLRYIIRNSGFTLASIIFVVGCFIHLQMVIFLPAHLYLLMCKNRGLRFYQHFRKYLLLVGAAAIMAIIVAFVHKYTSDLYFENIFLPLFKGKSIAPDYGIFRFDHLLDILNLLYLLSPVSLLLLFLSHEKLRRVFHKKSTAFLALISLSGLLFLITIDPKLGMARDWDLFSLSAVGPTLVLTMLISNKRLVSISRLWGTLLIFFLISACTPFLAVNLNNQTSIAYMEHLINLDKGKSLPALKTLHDFYRRHGNSDKADSLRGKFKEYYPNQNRIRMAITALNRGNLKSATEMARSIIPDRFSSDYYSLMSNIQLLRGNHSRALELSGKAI
ncbi:MAG: hypothetical protein JSU69_02210, partial [Candidatus Zixiibacteriota bacterium]